MRTVSLFGMLFLAGCTISPEVVKQQFAKAAPPVVTKQASFDFDCAADQIQVSNIAARVFGARGCGKKASYEVTCNADAYDGVRAESCRAKINGTVLQADAK